MIREGKVIAKKFFEDYDGKELGNIIGDFVNCFSFDMEGFIDGVKEEKDKEKILDVALLWLIKLKFLKNIGYYDLRNKYSVELGVKIVEVLHDEVEKIRAKYRYEGVVLDEDYKRGSYLVDTGGEFCIEDIELVPMEKEVMLVETIARDHRTLQQSFSEMIFKTLTIFPQIKEKIGTLEEEIMHIPLI